MKSKLLSLLVPSLLIMAGQDISAQPVPHHFDSISVAPSNTMTLSLNGSVSNMFILSAAVSNQFRQMFDLYPLDSSPDLAAWTRQTILLRTNNDSNPLLYQETNDPSVSAQFYRTPTNQLITGFPKPTGQFAVGTLVRVLTDSSRSNRYGIKTNSSFMSTFWYPAAPPNAGTLPGAYTDAAVAADRNFYFFWSWPIQWTNIMLRCVTHSFPGLPLASGTNRFPIILHSHGWTCDRTFNSQDAAELASHGYIVAAVDHEDCHATVYPDTRGARYAPPQTVINIDSSVLVPSRTNDLEYLLGELSQMDDTDPVLAGRLDLEHIGVMGLSYGGGTAAEVARLDERVKCAALLEPAIWTNVYPALFSQGLQKPFLVMNTPIWTHTSITPSPSEFLSMSQTLYNLANTNATWFTITGISHIGGLSDLAWAVEMTSVSRQGAVAINASLLWFFDTYLKGEAPPFPTNPEISNVQRK